MRMNFPLVLIGMLVIILVVVIQSFQLPETKRQTVVGCVLVGDMTDNGWNYSHYQGLSAACRAHDVAIHSVDNVAENESATYAAVEELIDKGANVIYLTSFGYGQYVDAIARKYPNVAFFCISDKVRRKTVPHILPVCIRRGTWLASSPERPARREFWAMFPPCPIPRPTGALMPMLWGY
jgi:basic membrane protein A